MSSTNVRNFYHPGHGRKAQMSLPHTCMTLSTTKQARLDHLNRQGSLCDRMRTAMSSGRVCFGTVFVRGVGARICQSIVPDVVLSEDCTNLVLRRTRCPSCRKRCSSLERLSSTSPVSHNPSFALRPKRCCPCLMQHPHFSRNLVKITRILVFRRTRCPSC